MNKFITLVKGELVRLYKYNLFFASIFVALIWIGILYFLDIDDVTTIVPQLIFIDVTTMAMLLIGVTHIYEREEATIRTILVSPISKSHYILSKLIGNIIPSILSLTLIYLYAKLFKIIDINYMYILLGVILVAFFHSLLGFLLAYYSKDFTGLLMIIVAVFLLSIFPVILDEFNIISSKIFKSLVYIFPAKSALMIIIGTTGIIKGWEIGVSLLYIILGSILLYYIIWKNFEKQVQKESGE